MGTSVYSFGEDSPIKVRISDKMATLYNEAVREFFAAQQRFNQKFGRPWNPETDPIKIKWSSKQRRAWDNFGKIFTKVIEKEGPFYDNDILDDFLVKNTLDTVDQSLHWGDVVYRVAFSGAIFMIARELLVRRS